jgi:hypothetical protein
VNGAEVEHEVAAQVLALFGGLILERKVQDANGLVDVDMHTAFSRPAYRPDNNFVSAIRRHNCVLLVIWLVPELDIARILTVGPVVTEHEVSNQNQRLVLPAASEAQGFLFLVMSQSRGTKV